MIYKSEPYAFYGKSTDTNKPTPEEFPSLFDDNLVLFYELDTGDIKYYDIEDNTWAVYPTSNGGGLNGGSNTNPNLSEAENATLDLMEAGIIDPLTDNEGNILVDSNNTIYTE